MLASIALWLMGLELIGLAAFPLAARLFAGWPDLGFAWAKILGLILVAYLAWLSGMLGLTAFTGPTIVVVGLGLALWAWRVDGHRVRSSWSEARGLVLVEEAVLLGTFLLATGVRAYNAPIAGQEKPMDFTFLYALIRAESLPAEDPWLAGFALPYYYFGYLTHALVAKAAAVEPAVAYNLAVATTWALGAVGAFGLVAGATRLAGASFRSALLWGGSGAFALSAMGNLEAFFEVLASQGVGDEGFWRAVGIKNLPGAAQASGLFPLEGAWWFRAARVIPNIEPDGITEFPYFSFLLGDLHPHYMAIPLAVLVAALATQQIFGSRAVDGSQPQPLFPRLEFFLGGNRGRALTHGVVLGSVIPTNTWDVPVFWGVFASATVAGALRAGVGTLPLARVAVQLAALFLLSALLYAPYFVGYMSQPLALGLVGERTPFGTLLVLFGALLLLPVAAGLVAVEPQKGLAAANSLLHRLLNRRTRGLVVAVGLVLAVVAVGLVLAGEPTLGLLIAALVLWLSLTLARALSGHAPIPVAAALLTSVGLAALLLPEVLFIRDVFGTRMNTVFKLYYDAWILLALAAPLLARELLLYARFSSASVWVRGISAGLLGAAGALVLAGALYPAAATYTKSGGFQGSPTLDGMAYLRALRPEDARIIEWLAQMRPAPRLIEAVGGDYTYAARFSTFAATVSPIGWVGHELQWRGSITELERRREVVRQLYADPSGSAWRDALGPRGMELVVVGGLEREIYGARVGQGFEGVLEPVYRSGTTTVYRLSRG